MELTWNARCMSSNLPLSATVREWVRVACLTKHGGRCWSVCGTACACRSWCACRKISTEVCISVSKAMNSCELLSDSLSMCARDRFHGSWDSEWVSLEKWSTMHSTAGSRMRMMTGPDAFAVSDAELLVADLTYLHVNQRCACLAERVVCPFVMTLIHGSSLEHGAPPFRAASWRSCWSRVQDRGPACIMTKNTSS